MDGFPAAYLANLLANLSARLIELIAPRFPKWQSDQMKPALERCLHLGIMGIVARASLDEPDQETLLADIFERFFSQADVAKQLLPLARGQSLDEFELQYLFEQAGYDVATLPGLQFAEALTAFEAAFREAAALEPVLHPLLPPQPDWPQTELQQVQAGEMRQMIQKVRRVDVRRLAIKGGRIIIEQLGGIQADEIKGVVNVVSGSQTIQNQTIVYQLSGETSPLLSTAWETDYLKAVIAQCGGLDLTLLDAAEARQEKLSVATVFTTLYLAGESRLEGEPLTEALRPAAIRRKESQRQGETKDRLAKQEDKKRLPIAATEAAAALPRLVILGRPGGGKSTLVNHIVTQLARRRRGEEADLPFWPDDYTPLPVLIVLRDFDKWLTEEQCEGAVGDLWDYLEKKLLPRWGCAHAFPGFSAALRSQQSIIFFDGLDELRQAETRRDIIRGVVEKFAEMEEQCQVVVTSRPYAYEDSEWQLPDDQFVVVRLASFEAEQIEAFNEAWYTKVIKNRRNWSEAECRREAAQLSRTILNRPHLYRLAQSPLLLTLIAQVHSHDSHSTLPNNRAALYEKMVDLLLDRWEKRLQDETPAHGEKAELSGLDVPLEEMRNLLAKLAYEGHEKQGKSSNQADSDTSAEISYRELRMALAERFNKTPKETEPIIAYIQHRAGLLRDKGNGVFDFPHRTYQEYLAARHLLNQSDGLEQLCQKVKEQPDWWREVFLLSAGSSMNVPKNVQDLVNTLLPFSVGEEGIALTAELTEWILIAAQALWETNFYTHVKQEKEKGGFTAVYRRVQGWLAAAMTADLLLPAAKRAEAGQRLAQLGDNRFGVGYVVQNGKKIPTIVWGAEITVKAGTLYDIGDDKSDYEDEKPRQVKIQGVEAFRLAQYPITNAQFQCFLDAAERDDEKWWQSIPEVERQFSEPRWPYANHPRETVSWYQAMAFCRWLTAKLCAGELPAGPLTGDLQQYTITLPHEYEWEVAARWPNRDVEQRIYPWGPEFDAAKANTAEGGIGQTTAVGIYPSSRNKAFDLYDLSGNVWEWCRNKYDNPDDDQVDGSNDGRVLRGGSFDHDSNAACAAARNSGAPDARDSYLGFRVVVRRPPSHLDR